MKFFAAPRWFQVWMAAWFAAGIPSFVLGQGFRGSFSILPDPPPFMAEQGINNLAEMVLVTLIWLLAILLIYAPVFALPALFIWRRRHREQ